MLWQSLYGSLAVEASHRWASCQLGEVGGEHRWDGLEACCVLQWDRQAVFREARWDELEACLEAPWDGLEACCVLQ